MDLYQKKYLKYKAKYQLLKKQYGGNKRLMNDLREIQREQSLNDFGITLLPSDNLFVQTAIINGVEGTPFEGYRWRVRLNFPQDYPYKAPTAYFIDRMFHPNVAYNSGEICIDILKTAWSPALKIHSILVSLQSLLSDPNPSSPLNSEAGRLFSSNRDEYNRRVREESARMKASQPDLEVLP
jgi:ubiquitin-conjugating enzyme E2 A